MNTYHSPTAAVVRPLLIIVSTLLLASCTTTRRVIDIDDHQQTEQHITVTTRDTTHLVIVHDTTIVTMREVITEHIINRYDPETGHLTQQEIDRQVQRRADSIATHRIDSLMQAHAADSLVNLQQQSHHTEHQETQADPHSFWHTLADRLSSVIVLAIIIAAIVISLRYYRKQP